jgi:iron(III) transport system substrate-binding protein
VTLYCAADRELAQGVLERFERESGVHVDSKWDTEAAKTIGLAEAIESERARPRCDLFWDNEPLQVVLLARRGALAPLPQDVVDAAGSAPRDAKGLWLGFAARARVLIVNTALVSSDQRPRSFRDLGDARWRGKTGIANPLFGSTSTHVAALFAKLGESEARAWLEALRQNEVAVCAGNAEVKNRVAAGELAFGLTDTDDVYSAVSEGKPVAVVFPDQAAGELGTLVLPNALALTAGGPHPEAAGRLLRFLASSAAEGDLARGAGQQLPLLPGGEKDWPSWIPRDLRALSVSWDAVADAHPAARAAVKSVLLAGK